MEIILFVIGAIVVFLARGVSDHVGVTKPGINPMGGGGGGPKEPA